MTSPENGQGETPSPNFESALRTQRAILNASFLWNLPLSSNCHEVSGPNAQIDTEESEGDRMIHVDVPEDGEWRVEWDNI